GAFATISEKALQSSFRQGNEGHNPLFGSWPKMAACFTLAGLAGGAVACCCMRRSSRDSGVQVSEHLQFLAADQGMGAPLLPPVESHETGSGYRVIRNRRLGRQAEDPR
ncbi:hypothetical protein FOZ63_008610, partial [Perkinsus olseni]